MEVAYFCNEDRNVSYPRKWMSNLNHKTNINKIIEINK
jgi:hypothetical protein